MHQAGFNSGGLHNKQLWCVSGAGNMESALQIELYDVRCVQRVH